MLMVWSARGSGLETWPVRPVRPVRLDGMNNRRVRCDHPFPVPPRQIGSAFFVILPAQPADIRIRLTLCGFVEAVFGNST